MIRIIRIILVFLLLAHCLFSKNVITSSPDGRIKATFSVNKAGHLVYTVSKKGKTVILPSPVGIIVDSVDLGENVNLGSPIISSFSETYSTTGVHARAVNNYNEIILSVLAKNPNGNWTLEIRTFNDAVAYRYRVEGNGSRKINGEVSAWTLPAACTLWYQNNKQRDYEAPFLQANPDTISRPLQLMTTATFKLPENQGYTKITEANLLNYSDMALEISGSATFKSLFHNSLKGWLAEGEIVSPWRVVIVADDLNALVNTDVIQNLCPAPAPDLVNAAWIQPGRSTWHWMVTGQPKLEDQTKWIDWTKTLGFEYYIIDDGWIKWTKDKQNQWACMKKVVDYAKSQNVKIWAWTHSKELFTPEQRKDYFARANAAGIVGLKIDFMKPADLVWVKWYDDCLRDAAKYKLMVNFHGAVKPTGRERTWPNELTREGIRGREMGKQPAMHDISLIFTCFVQGHADYTPTDFRPEKLKGSTFAHELAMAVAFTSPLFCFSGRPEDYIAGEAFQLLKTLPVTWDETIVLPGSEIGKLAAMARRKGNDWYIAVLNADKTDNFKIQLAFLGTDSYTIEKFEDVAGNNEAWLHSTTTIPTDKSLTINLSKDGGFVAKITRK